MSHKRWILSMAVLAAAGMQPGASGQNERGDGIVLSTTDAEAIYNVGPITATPLLEMSPGATVEFNGELFPALAALPPPPILDDLPQWVGPDGFPEKDEDGMPKLDDPLVKLGYILFFDPRFSGDGSVSCSTCHVPAEGWGLNSAVSRGYPGTSHWRNSQTVVNSAYMNKLFWGGDTPELGQQAEDAKTGLSGNAKPDMVEERIAQVPEYVEMFKEVFGTQWPLEKDAWRAMGAFERVMNDENTFFDQYMRGDETAMTEEELLGMELFQGKAGCIQCHNGPLLTDQKYYNTGAPESVTLLRDPLVQTGARWQYYRKGIGEDVYRKANFDIGLYSNTKVKGHMGLQRTAPLRYLLYTPPYMHNGSIDTLEEVVEFYNQGGGPDPVLRDLGYSTKTDRLKPLNLTEDESFALVVFLESTSGEELLLPSPEIPSDQPFAGAIAKFGDLEPETFDDIPPPQ
ncbi:MAG: cytochrome c peroxidase [Planctomycetota bacterium]|nr:cytochrome c peroxidase [Planctomycetota bacterium]